MKRTCKQIVGVGCASVLMLLNACIENDIPYPRIKAEILAIEAEGQLEAATISTTNRSVRFSMDEEVDMEKVQLLKLDITEDAIISPELDSTSIIDLSTPQKYTLSIYQDYEWTISAEQVIERYFHVNNQVGQELIDYENKIAVAYVEEGTDLSAIKISGLKLGPASGSIIPDYDKITDFTETGGVKVVIIYRNIRESWTLFVAYGDAATLSVDAWETVAWLNGSGRNGGDNGFEYRLSTSESWTKVDNSQVTHNGGVFTARLSGLREGTSYVARSYSDEDYSEEVTFTLATTEQLPNYSFENWHKPDKPWLIYGEYETMFWDSGNHGSTTVSGSHNTTMPDETTFVDGKKSAKLESRYVFIKFAAGNLFSGEYVDTDGISGAILDFGRPFTKHPTKLKGYLKYEPGVINRMGDNNTLPNSLIQEGAVEGKTDKAHVWVTLRDASSPIRINNTNRPSGLYNYKTDPNLIAYGEFIQHEATPGNGMVPFEIELEYYHTARTPTYISIVCTASKYGDYFVGSDNSTLWLDNFELVYD